MKNIVLLIPSFNPDETFIDFIKDAKESFKDIVVVNDGSLVKYDYIFLEIAKLDVVVIKHHVNLGKGRALKTGFNYILNNYSNAIGVVTADSDGQHSIKDIKKCARALIGNKKSFIIGVRNFDNYNVPRRSKMGNIITRFVFKILFGIDITDTQTGLRVLSTNLIRKFMNTLGERFDYETNMLIGAIKNDINIVEVPIETIYINNNIKSHFNIIRDSYQIYKLFIKYALLSLSTFILDIILFIIFITMLDKVSPLNIVVSIILSRVIASIYNYYINYGINNLIKYYSSVVIKMLIASLLVVLINMLFKDLILIKILVDIIVFIASLILVDNIF